MKMILNIKVNNGKSANFEFESRRNLEIPEALNQISDMIANNWGSVIKGEDVFALRKI